LEKRLQHEGDQTEDNVPVVAVREAILEAVRSSASPDDAQTGSDQPKEDSSTTSPPDGASEGRQQSNYQSPSSTSTGSFPSSEYAILLLDTYFGRIHGKPYHVFDEASTRQRMMSNQLPHHLSFAIFAVSARWDHMLTT
jgi:hypothetical protein